MKTIKTYIGVEAHLGDNLWHLNWLRRCALANPSTHFIHAAPYPYLRQMIDIVSDLENVTLVTEDSRKADFECAWVGHNWFAHKWRATQLSFDTGELLLAHFADLSTRLGLENPIKTQKDLLFDYPALRYPLFKDPLDFLILSQEPRSGQSGNILPKNFEPIAVELAKNYTVVTTTFMAGIPCTLDHNLNLTDVGNLSLQAKYIIGIPNGPVWPTLNVLNAETVKLRIHISHPEYMTVLPTIRTVKNLDELKMELIKNDLLPLEFRV